MSQKMYTCTVFNLIALITAPWLFTLFSLIIADMTIFFLTLYLIFTYYRSFDLSFSTRERQQIYVNAPGAYEVEYGI